METHVRVLGYLHIGFSILTALVGVGLLAMFGGIAGLLAMTEGQADPDALAAIPILGVVGVFLCGLLLVLSIPGIIAGYGLLKFRGWARILTIVLSAIQLLNVPFGTALGVYGLWVLLSEASEPLFHPHPARAY